MPQTYLEAINYEAINWQWVAQRCQITYHVVNPHVMEIYWETPNSCPIIQKNQSYYRVKAHDAVGLDLTLRDVFKAVDIVNADFELSWPENQGHNIHNILDTTVFLAPICQMEIYPIQPHNPNNN